MSAASWRDGCALLSEMKVMTEENKQLKRMYAEGQMQNKLLEGSRKKVNSLQRKEMVQWTV